MDPTKTTLLVTSDGDNLSTAVLPNKLNLQYDWEEIHG